MRVRALMFRYFMEWNQSMMFAKLSTTSLIISSTVVVFFSVLRAHLWPADYVISCIACSWEFVLRLVVVVFYCYVFYLLRDDFIWIAYFWLRNGKKKYKLLSFKSFRRKMCLRLNVDHVLGKSRAIIKLSVQLGFNEKRI